MRMVAEGVAELTTDDQDTKQARRQSETNQGPDLYCSPVRDYNIFEPAPLTFIVLPVFLACLLVWGTAVAWRRSGAPIDAIRRAAALSSVAACAWMAITWRVAASGIFREWERTPP